MNEREDMVNIKKMLTLILHNWSQLFCGKSQTSIRDFVFICYRVMHNAVIQLTTIKAIVLPLILLSIIFLLIEWKIFMLLILLLAVLLLLAIRSTVIQKDYQYYLYPQRIGVCFFVSLFMILVPFLLPLLLFIALFYLDGIKNESMMLVEWKHVFLKAVSQGGKLFIFLFPLILCFYIPFYLLCKMFLPLLFFIFVFLLMIVPLYVLYMYKRYTEFEDYT